MCCLLCVPVWAQSSGDDVADEPVFEIEIPASNAAEALNRLAEQTGAILLFPYDLADSRQTNAVAGQYTLMKALSELLKDSGLSGGLSDRRVIQIAADDASITTIDDTSKSGENAMNTTRKAGLVAIIAGTLSGGVGAQEPTVAETDIQTSVVTGTVTDVRTGANLKGARVTVEETGQWVSTGDLGQFRFANVPRGSVTLTVSSLGYAAQSTVLSVRGDSAQQDFALRGGTEIEEIVVFGQRSARAQALNQERTAPNVSTVVSADQLGQFNGTTISEALRRAPGIAFVPDPVTGDGAQIIVRGLRPDLNQVTLNGSRLLDGTGLGRSPDLSSILTESVESVTLHKSLLPSQDSNGAGALVEIVTKAPLDRDRRFASLGLEYGETDSDFGDELGVSGTVSGIFGRNGDFGASLSASYRERDVTRIAYDQGPGYASFEVSPLTNGAGDVVTVPVRDIEPTARFPFESEFNRLYPTNYSANQGSSDQETLSAVGALQKTIGDHTELRFDAVYTQDKTATYNTATSIWSSTHYDLAPVEALNGEVRRVLVSENLGGSDPNSFFSLVFGPGIPGFVSRNIDLSPDEDAETFTLRLAGETTRNAWTFNYSAGFSESKNSQGQGYSLNVGNQSFGPTGFFSELISRDLLSEEALNNVTGDGRIISVFPAFENGANGRFLLPLFSDDGFAYINSADNFPVELVVSGPRESKGQEVSLFSNARRDFDSGFLKYVEVGVDYRETEFFSPGNIQGSALGALEYVNAADATASDLGLDFGPGILTQIGIANDLSTFQRGNVESFVDNIGTLVSGGLLEIDREGEPRLTQSRDTTEDTLAAYIEARGVFNKLEIIGGVRVERIDVGSTFFASPRVTDVDGVTQLIDIAESSRLASDSASQTSVLPRLLANYHFSDNMLLRASYFTTVSRPQLSNLTDSQSLALLLNPSSSTTGDRPVLQVRQGNPELEPATTHSFDLSFEWYSSNVGVLKVGAFYKEIENPLQDTRQIGGLSLLPEDLVLPPDISFFNPLPDPIEIVVTRPVNGEDDNTIYGFEVTGEQQLTFLPEIWSGLGVYANYTYTDSESTQRLVVNTDIDPRGFVEVDNVPFEGSPKHQGTIGLTYNGYNLDASLLYSAQDRRLSSLRAYGLSLYEEAIDTLDLRVEYLLDFNDSTVRLFLRAEDLLSSTDDAFLQSSIGGENGVPTYYTGGTYLGGRSLFLGASMTF